MNRDHDHARDLSTLIDVVARLERQLEALPRLATKHDLHETQCKIMSAISDFAAQVDAFNDKVDKAIDGLQADVNDLKQQIAVLQNSSGAITPEDQATLDRIQQRAAAVADKLSALDAQTEQAPTPPVG